MTGKQITHIVYTALFMVTMTFSTGARPMIAEVVMQDDNKPSSPVKIAQIAKCFTEYFSCYGAHISPTTKKKCFTTGGHCSWGDPKDAYKCDNNLKRGPLKKCKKRPTNTLSPQKLQPHLQPVPQRLPNQQLNQGLKIEIETFESIEVHEMVRVDGLMEMRAVTELVIPATGQIHLEPGGKHFMLMGPREHLIKGQRVVMTLIFQSGKKQTVSVQVAAK